MPKTDHPDGPAVAAFVADLTPEERRKRELVLSLTPEERGALPLSLRRLAPSEEALVWAAAKAERDAAIEAATTIDEETGEKVYDAEAVAAARGAWQARKAELRAEG